MTSTAGLPEVSPVPPLSVWQRTWRTLAALGFGVLAWAPMAAAQWEKTPWLVALDIGLGLFSIILMQFRRRWPWPVAMLTTVAASASATSFGSGIIAYISMSTRRRWPEILSVGLVSVGGGLVYFAVEPGQSDSWYVNLFFGAAITAIAAAIGMYIGARRELLANLKERAERAEREQELHVATAQANERTRIAREMHDVLAHRMSLVAVHAGALAYRADLTAAETRETAEIIQSNSHRALSDLREILGVLRDTEQGIDVTDHRPQPTLDDLDCLLSDERAAGANITVTGELSDLTTVPDSIGRNAYRIIQESLTNARKHAPRAAVTIGLSGAAGVGLSLEVRNPIRVGASHQEATKPGFGLIGLAERATASHGRFEHGLTPDGAFVVRAWLPWQT